jgi:hypothetical protein
MAAIHALWLVHANKSAAVAARPFDLVLGNEMLHADCSDTVQVPDDAYLVFGPVAAIEMKQRCTGEPSTGKAKLMAASR